MKTSSMLSVVAVGAIALCLVAYTFGGQGRSESAVLKIERAVACLAFSPDGKHLVAGTDNGTKEELTFWTGELLTAAQRSKLSPV